MNSIINLSLFLFAFMAYPYALACKLPEQATVLINNGNKLLQYGDLDDDENLWKQNRPQLNFLDEFRGLASKKVDVNVINILVRQRKFENTGDRENIDLILTGRIEHLKPINCIEALLFNFQASRRPMVSKIYKV